VYNQINFSRTNSYQQVANVMLKLTSCTQTITVDFLLNYA